MPIRYRSLQHWKYQLMERYEVSTPITSYEHQSPFYRLDRSGVLTVEVGYCWDGPSGPTWDSPSTLRPSLIHDVFYQLIRLGVIPMRERKVIDDFFHRGLIVDGMGSARAWMYWKSIRAFGWYFAGKPEKKQSSQIKEAP